MTKRDSETPVYTLVVAWVVLLPALFFVARGTFSFDHAEHNNALTYGAGTIVSTGAGSTYYRFEQAAFYLIICLLIWRVFPSISRVISRVQNIWLILLPVWGGLSLLWSQAPDKTIFASLPMLFLTVFGVYLAIRFSPERQVQFFLFVGIASLLLSFILIALYPSGAIENIDGKGAWLGLFAHKNHCGMVMTYLIVPAFCVRANTVMQRIWIAVYVFADLFLIAMTQSRTGWLLAACCLVFMGSLKVATKLASKERVLLFLAIAIFSSLFAILSVTYMSQISMLLGKDATLTGRVGIWTAIWPVLRHKPFLGYGYRAFWLGMRGESANLEVATGYLGLANAENAVLQMWLELGVVGVFIMLMGILRCCKNAAACMVAAPSRYTLWCVTNLFLTVLSLVDGDKIMFPNTIEWVLYVISYISLASIAHKGSPL